MQLRQGKTRRKRSFARRGSMSDHLNELRVGSTSCCDVQVVTYQLNFIFHAALIAPVHHGCGERENIGAARALDNPVIRLRDANGSSNPRPFLLQVEIRGTE